MTTLSIALITYNGEKFLQRQLETLAAQTRLPDELVVCDDASSDGTVAILRHFAETAPFPVRIFENPTNLGGGENFRRAFFLCEGDVTFFCDQDDVWFPDKLEKALAVLEAEPDVGLLLMNDVFVNADEKPIFGRSHPSHRVVSAIQRRNCAQSLLACNQFGWAAHNMVCRTAWRNAIFQEGFPPIADAIDPWIFQTMAAFSNVRVLLEPSVAFRRHGGNATAHAKKERNPLKLLVRSIRRHMDVTRIWGQATGYQQLVGYLERSTCEIAHPEVLALYRRLAAHRRRRTQAIAHPLWRPWLILRETLNGNYFRFSKGVKDILTDLVIWPQSPPEMPTEMSGGSSGK